MKTCQGFEGVKISNTLLYLHCVDRNVFGVVSVVRYASTEWSACMSWWCRAGVRLSSMPWDRSPLSSFPSRRTSPPTPGKQRMNLVL